MNSQIKTDIFPKTTRHEINVDVSIIMNLLISYISWEDILYKPNKKKIQSCIYKKIKFTLQYNISYKHFKKIKHLRIIHKMGKEYLSHSGVTCIFL